MEGLRDYMVEHELTQAELAELLRVSQPTVSDWLNGNTKPTVDRLLSISEKIGLSVDELLKGRSH
jgi:transcriptional regulator with XRE-family HTH domain